MDKLAGIFYPILADVLSGLPGLCCSSMEFIFCFSNNNNASEILLLLFFKRRKVNKFRSNFKVKINVLKSN